jgi:hypothetical protein
MPLYTRGHWIPIFQSHRLLLIKRVEDSNLQGVEESNGSSSNDSNCIALHHTIGHYNYVVAPKTLQF